MAIELKKEMLPGREVIVRTGCEAFTDIDIIVPDVKPDVVRILQIDANPVIMDKTLLDEKLLFDCRLDVCILYAADNGCVKSIRTQQSFSHQVANKAFQKGMSVEAYCSVSRLDCRVVNSRKLAISATVAIDYSVTRERELPIITGIDSEGCQVRYSPVKAYIPWPQAITEISVRETFHVPQGKPDADEILRTTVRLCNKDIRFAGSKAVVKGDLICTILYVCDMEPCALQTAEFSLPFTEVVDLPDMDEGENCNIDFVYKTVNCSVKQDGDGDNRIIYIEVYMDAVVNSGREVAINAVADAYSADCDLDISYQPVMLEELVAKDTAKEQVKCAAPLPSGQPEIAGVFNVTAVPGAVTAAPSGKSVLVEGELYADILYKTTDPDMPVGSFSHTMPFTCSFDMSQVDERCLFDVNVDVDNISYNITLADEVELRCNISVCISAMRANQVRCITSIEEHPLPEAEPCNAYCVRIYYVRKGDSLWNIAKKYRVCLNRLMKLNNLNEESVIMPGQRLMIP